MIIGRKHLKIGLVASIMFLTATLLRTQSITISSLPFAGIQSLYETDTVTADIASFSLTQPGEAQVWQFDLILDRQAADTLVFTKEIPDSLSHIATLKTVETGSDARPPSTSFYQIAHNALLHTARSDPAQPHRMIRFQKPVPVHPVPLDVGASWQAVTPVEFSDETSQVLSEAIQADATGSLILANQTYFTIRLQVQQTITVDEKIISEKRLYRWIAPYVGLVLEIESDSNESQPHFTQAKRIRRLVISNADEFGCDPSCDPSTLELNDYGLYSNYPNPFNQQTRIPYTLAHDSEITLTIQNILGQTVVQWHDFKPAGRYNQLWQGTDAFNRTSPGGVYFIRLHARPRNGLQPFSATNRMILIR